MSGPAEIPSGCSWQIRTVRAGSSEEAALLADGWEPFATYVAKVEQRSGTCNFVVRMVDGIMREYKKILPNPPPRRGWMEIELEMRVRPRKRKRTGTRERSADPQ